MGAFMLKKIISIFILCTFLIAAHTDRPAVIAESKNETTLINSFERDMNGNGFDEYLRLEGNLLNQNNHFYQDVRLLVKNKFKKEWTIALQHGYQPKAELIDLTGNKNPDLFYEVAKDEQKNHFHYQLYHFNENQVKAVELPNHQYVKLEFTNDFKVKITGISKSKPEFINLSEKKDLYISEGVYNKDGKPSDIKKPAIDQFGTMEPVLLSKSKGYGLKTTHHIHGVNEEDLLGSVVTIWYFENGNWINLNTKVIPAA